MNDKLNHLELIGNENSFYIKYLRSSNTNLNTLLNKYKFNLNNYYIYKNTRKQKEVTLEEFYIFKYSGYVFFNKFCYEKEYIDNFINLIYVKLKIEMLYLMNKIPPYDNLSIKKINPI